MTEPLRAGRACFRAHGLGNDYLVFEEGDAWPVSPEAVRAVCHRWEGVGSDGIVVLLGGEGPPGGGTAAAAAHAAGASAASAAPAAPRFRLRMFNPDGSEFERSGNGLRVLAAFLAADGRVGEEPFAVEVGGDRLVMRVHDRLPGGHFDVSVEMGRVRFGPGAVGLDASALAREGVMELEGVGPVDVELVSVGNPHAVVFGQELERERLEAVGPALSAHPAFASGTNVQLAAPAGERRVRALIWERGVGHTFASGTSSCAVAAASARRGLVEPGEVEVAMEGGSLFVTVGPDDEVTLRGPVQAVCRSELLAGFVETLS